MKESEEQAIHLDVAIVGGVNMDLSAFDFSPWRVCAHQLNTDGFHVKLKELSNGEEQYERNLANILKRATEIEGAGKHVDKDRFNVFWPIDTSELPDEDDYHMIVSVLRLFFPSNVHVYRVLWGNVFDDGSVFIGLGGVDFNLHYHGRDTNEMFEYLIVDQEDVLAVNVVLPEVKRVLSQPGYVQNAFNFYSGGFHNNSMLMSFLCYCIALESIVDGKEQLSFRLRRNISVLCGVSVSGSERIFKNIGLIYAKRSQLVHDGKSFTNREAFNAYYQFVRLIASRMVVEMIMSGVEDIQELNNILNQSSFGAKKSLFQKRIEYEAPAYITVYSNHILLKKESQY